METFAGLASLASWAPNEGNTHGDTYSGNED